MLSTRDQTNRRNKVENISISSDDVENSKNVIFNSMKLIGVSMSLWPLDTSASKLRYRIYNFVWWFNILNFSFSLLAVLIETYRVRKNILKFPIAWMEVIAISECLIVYVTSRVHKNRLKILLRSVDDIMNCGDLEKRKIIMENYKLFTKCFYLMSGSYIVLIVSYFIDDTMNSFDNFMLKAWYPFPTNYLLVKILILIHQIYVTFASLCLIVLDSICCIIIFCAIARFDILAENYEKAHTCPEISSCVRNHQDLICFVNQFIAASRICIIKAVLASIGYFISAGFCLMQVNIGCIILKPFIAVLVTASTRLLVYAYTAEKIIDKHEHINFTIYNSNWYQRQKKFIKTLTIIMQRCQKPIKITYSKFFKPLSMAVFSEYAYTSFTYLMALLTIQKKYV